MSWFLLFLGASVFSSIFVLAAGMLSSRVNRQEDVVESFYVDAKDAPAPSGAQAIE
ncbi:MAG: hypothetical protein KIS95_03655 [Anaerolineae bacterium]|uniref:hypothetical protein n=1 Tax=Promineifilum sp. TaxID=2664178 RepID=UPI001DF23F91|nr:hypothetical protein [Anaerolineales bacterium]MCB8933828.1 hypothetical protein [Promineifilum sp.]MCO5181419.1 hypothetical protein [Promineifilum sp.]MCW5846301.1 hypothetical protein [Anaerolineae bacterium]